MAGNSGTGGVHARPSGATKRSVKEWKMASIRRFGTILALAVAAVAMLGNVHGVLAGAPGRSTVALTITDSSYSIPTTVPAGYTAINVTNAGTMPHAASFVKLNPGVTLQQVVSFS